MGKIVAIANQKGGVGKTTTCTSLCCALKNRGRKVLICDCDAQGNCTSGMGVDKSQSPNIYDILVNSATARECIVETKYGDVIPSNKELSGASIELVTAKKREYVLKTALEAVRDEYDFIIIDCPPSLELLTLNALVAADTVLVPVQCEYYALEGLSDLINTIKLTTKKLNPTLDIEGILLTMYDSRTNFSNQVADEIKNYFGEKVYKTFIPRNVRLAEAPSHGKPIIAYDKLSKGSRAYMKFANEFIKRQSPENTK